MTEKKNLSITAFHTIATIALIGFCLSSIREYYKEYFGKEVVVRVEPIPPVLKFPEIKTPYPGSDECKALVKGMMVDLFRNAVSRTKYVEACSKDWLNGLEGEAWNAEVYEEYEGYKRLQQMAKNDEPYAKAALKVVDMHAEASFYALEDVRLTRIDRELGIAEAKMKMTVNSLKKDITAKFQFDDEGSLHVTVIGMRID